MLPSSMSNCTLISIGSISSHGAQRLGHHLSTLHRQPPSLRSVPYAPLRHQARFISARVRQPEPSRLTCTAISSASPRLTSDGGGGSGDVPELRWAGEEEPEDGDSTEREKILAKDGTTFEELPKDLQSKSGQSYKEPKTAYMYNMMAQVPVMMQAALQRGAMSAAELQQWLALAAKPILGALSRWFPAFRDRLMGNPRFLLVLTIEEVIGCTAKTIAEYQARGKDFWKEIDFVMSDLSLEIIGDFAIVWLLSPKKSFSAAPSGGLSQFVSRLPGHSLQVGGFPLRYRLASIALRGAQFFAVGCFASTLGHSLTIHLAEKRRQKLVGSKALKRKEGGPKLLAALPLDVEPEKALAPVARNSICWGTFMATSCNARYQLLNGLEERYLAKMIPNKGLSTAFSALMRFSNTIVGSAQWIFIARQLGLQ